MKILIAFFSVSVLLKTVIDIKPFVIDRIELRNETLLNFVDSYLNEYKQDLASYGVLMLIYDPSNKVYYVTHKMYKRQIEESPASFFFVRNGRVVVVYTGFEKNLNFSKDSFVKLYRIADRFFADPNYLQYDADLWRIFTENDGVYKKEVVKTLPFDY